jgi:hypothetical protein
MTIQLLHGVRVNQANCTDSGRETNRASQHCGAGKGNAEVSKDEIIKMLIQLLMEAISGKNGQDGEGKCCKKKDKDGDQNQIIKMLLIIIMMLLGQKGKGEEGGGSNSQSYGQNSQQVSFTRISMTA